jgi:uncharacterized membrane protein YqiK
MEEIFKQYGAPVIIVSVIVALIAIFALLLNTNNGAIIGQFQSLITKFFEEAKFTSTILPGLLG